jgi:integrase
MKNDDFVKIIAEQAAEIDRLRKLRSNALTGELSDSKIAKLTKHWTRDCDNLYIQVQNKGSRRRSWLFRWVDRKTGKYKSIGLGPYPTVSIDQAREKALIHRQQLLEGKDPRKERDAEKVDILIARKLVKSVHEVTDEWFEKDIARKSPQYRGTISNQLHKYVYPTIGNMPIQKVDANIILDKVGSPRKRDGEGEVFEPLREMWPRITPTANDVLRWLERIFKFAIKRKYYHGENPAVEARDSLPSKSDVYRKKHRSELPYEDVGRFMQALRAYEDRSVRKEGHPPIAFLLEFNVLTGARLSEGRFAQWKEFDLPSMTWTTPWQHLKMGRVHQKNLPRPITKPMLAMLGKITHASPGLDRDALIAHLEEIKRTSPDALVFPGPRSGKAISTGNMAVFVANVIRWDIKIHAHAFRGTLRNWMHAKTTFKDKLWKIQVDHKVGIDESDAAYGRDKLLEQRRPFMELWGEYCSKPAPQPQTGDVVVNISDKRKRRSE